MCQFECSSFCTHWTTVIIPEHSPLPSCFRNGKGEGTIPSAMGELHLQTDSASPLTHSKGGTSTGPQLRALGSEPLEGDSLRGPFPTRMWSQLPWPGFSQGGCSWKALPPSLSHLFTEVSVPESHAGAQNLHAPMSRQHFHSSLVLTRDEAIP